MSCDTNGGCTQTHSNAGSGTASYQAQASANLTATFVPTVKALIEGVAGVTASLQPFLTATADTCDINMSGGINLVVAIELSAFGETLLDETKTVNLAGFELGVIPLRNCLYWTGSFHYTQRAEKATYPTTPMTDCYPEPVIQTWDLSGPVVDDSNNYGPIQLSVVAGAGSDYTFSVNPDSSVAGADQTTTQWQVEGASCQSTTDTESTYVDGGFDLFDLTAQGFPHQLTLTFPAGVKERKGKLMIGSGTQADPDRYLTYDVVKHCLKGGTKCS